MRALLTVLAEISSLSTSLTISAIQCRTAVSSTRAIGVAANAGRSRLRPCASRSSIDPFVRYGSRSWRNRAQKVPKVSRATLTSPRSIDSTSRRRAVAAARRLVNPRRLDWLPSDCLNAKR